ncbi:MAG TPA: HEAT repeat domain-containing protein [Chthonomonadaceae bacterium]|nr:HEAT repeat domain-containing protein [Chthonomonadaceae bacterium]
MPDAEDKVIQDAIECLYSADKKRRLAAIKCLIAIGEPAIEPLMQVLQLPEPLMNDWALRCERARKAAARALAGIGKPGVVRLTSALQSSNAKVRAAAAHALQGIHDDGAVEAMRALLYREIAANRRLLVRWLGKKVVIVAFCALVLSQLIDWGQGLIGFVGILSSALLIAAMVLQYVDLAANVRLTAVTALANTGDPRLVGAFALCLSDLDREVRYTAANALRKLLPKVKASDKRYISPLEMHALLKALVGRDDPLRIAILKALEQIGDERALPNVEWIIESNEPLDVRRAAEECLPYLKMRAEYSEQAQTLLRAAEPSEAAAPDTLLRPAQSAAQTDASQLLRPQQPC